MNPIFQKIIIDRVVKLKKLKDRSLVEKADIDREVKSFKIYSKRSVKDLILITAGIFSAAFGLKGFLLPNSFIDGGVVGISLLATVLTNYSISLYIIIFNIPFILLGLNQLSKLFVIKSIIAIIGLAIVLALVSFPVITSDKLLVAVFGGVFLGLGTGFAIRGGAIIDGTEILAIYLDKRVALTVGEILLIINIIIFSVAAYLLSIEAALYSILTYVAATKTVDFIIEGIEEYTAVTIISDHHDEIREMLINKLEFGVTIYSGQKGYGSSGEDKTTIDILFTVITRLEVSRLTTEIEKIDSHAFVVMDSIKDTRGGMIKRKPIKKIHDISQ